MIPLGSWDDKKTKDNIAFFLQLGKAQVKFFIKIICFILYVLITASPLPSPPRYSPSIQLHTFFLFRKQTGKSKEAGKRKANKKHKKQTQNP